MVLLKRPDVLGVVGVLFCVLVVVGADLDG